jgi:hypothetical protein
MTPDNLKELAERLRIYWVSVVNDKNFKADAEEIAALLTALAEAKKVVLVRRMSDDRWIELPPPVEKLPQYQYATALILPEKP